MLATLGSEEAQRHQVNAIHTTVPAVFAMAFKITWVNGPVVSDLVSGPIRLAAIELRAKVEQLNSLIAIKAPLDALRWSELIEALHNVRNRAVDLQKVLGEHGVRKII
jgi:hypothetical protein